MNASFGEEVQAFGPVFRAVGLSAGVIGPLILSLLGALSCEIEVEWAGKPSSVVSVHLSGTAVARSLKRPTRG